MIVEYIRYKLTEHTAEELIHGYEEAAPFLSDAPECIGYELSRCTEDDKSMILRIEWTSAEDHLKGFRTGPHFPPFVKKIGKFVPEIAEMRHYTVCQTVRGGTLTERKG